jgi:hypothetical protein
MKIIETLNKSVKDINNSVKNPNLVFFICRVNQPQILFKKKINRTKKVPEKSPGSNINDVFKYKNSTQIF